jgi:prepilin-type N-terminal cleavage/methylation domain-containing protein
MNQKGVTLIELIIVIVIIGMGALMVTPGIGAYLPIYRLRGATRDIVSTMRVAQMKAVSSNTQYGVAFDANLGQYQVYYQSSGGLTPDGPINQLPQGIQLNSNGIPEDPVLNKHFLKFYADSTAVDGIIVLNNPKGSQKTIQLLGTTGRMKIE